MPTPTPRPDKDTLFRKEPATGDPHPVEHFLEVLLIAQDRAANETDASLLQVWRWTIRDIETVLADDMLEVVGARDRLARRTDPEGRRLHACACWLLSAHDIAEREAKEAIDRARRGQRPV